MSQRWDRIRLYLREMCPPAAVLPVGALKFAVVYATLQTLSGVAPLELDWRASIGALTIGLVMILMRVYDELKDAESDLRLGRAGDPRYRDRPLVRGAVLIEDVLVLRNTLTWALWLLNLCLWAWIPIAGFGLLFLTLWLSARWFYYPQIAKSLWLAFITHNPLSVLFGVYVVALFVERWGWSRLDVPYSLLLLLSMWFTVAAWETSRKVRLPEQETDYQTYSKLWGWRWAALVPAGFVVLGLGCAWLLLQHMALPAWVGYGLTIAAALPVCAGLRLRFWPTTQRTRLQPMTEAYAALTDIWWLGSLTLLRGVTWTN